MPAEAFSAKVGTGLAQKMRPAKQEYFQPKWAPVWLKKCDQQNKSIFSQSGHRFGSKNARRKET
jgi:hypothetical protein